MLITPLINSYSRFVAKMNQTPGVIDKSKAKVFIDMADDINSLNSWWCGTSLKGDCNLNRLVHEYSDRFDQGGRKLVHYWLEHHTLPRSNPRHSSWI